MWEGFVDEYIVFPVWFTFFPLNMKLKFMKDFFISDLFTVPFIPSSY